MTPIQQLILVRNVTDRITATCLEKKFSFRVQEDVKNRQSGRIFIQVVYTAECVKTGNMEHWHGRKWYLSEHMTADEIVKTAYAAFEAAVKHEIMEGFKVDGIVLFNPHVDFEVLLAGSHIEVKRK